MRSGPPILIRGASSGTGRGVRRARPPGRTADGRGPGGCAGRSSGAGARPGTRGQWAGHRDGQDPPPRGGHHRRTGGAGRERAGRRARHHLELRRHTAHMPGRPARMRSASHAPVRPHPAPVTQDGAGRSGAIGATRHTRREGRDDPRGDHPRPRGGPGARHRARRGLVRTVPGPPRRCAPHGRAVRRAPHPWAAGSRRSGRRSTPALPCSTWSWTTWTARWPSWRPAARRPARCTPAPPRSGSRPSTTPTATASP